MKLVDSTFMYLVYTLALAYFIYSIYVVLKSNSSDNSLSKILWIFLIFIIPIIGSTIAIVNYKLFNHKSANLKKSIKN